jgi:(heptosyl)LPS beta-1,4-glucosyltransferase
MSKKASITAMLIVKNAEKHLKACLDTLGWVDEIVVLDAGSDDHTRSIAEQAGVQYFCHQPWPGFGPQRQVAQSHVRSEWVFAIDADERVTPELQASIEAVLERGERNKVYRVKRKSWAFGRFIKHSGWYPDWVVRLYRREETQYNDALVHECVQVTAALQVKDLAGDLLHYTYDDIYHYLTKSAAYARAWAQQKAQQGKRGSLVRAVVHGVARFVKMYIFRCGFLDGRQGFLLALLSAHYAFVKYADLWVRQHDSRVSQDDDRQSEMS